MAPFSYDAASDPAYQAYKKQYAREGARSAENTLGQYAAMIGGVRPTHRSRRRKRWRQGDPRRSLLLE